MKLYTKLTKEDALQLLEIGEQFHKEAVHYKGSVFDKERVWKLFDKSVTSPSTTCVVYVKEGEEVVGAIMGSMSARFFSGERVATDLGMFLKPAYRGSSAFLKLFKAFEQWAIDNKAQHIVVGHTTGIEMEVGKTLFPRLGYSLMGYIFNKEIKQCVQA
jgi:Acetyltransferase (GNAT) family